MVRKIFVGLVWLLFSSLLFSETIYLNDGKILKGVITEEDENTVIIETDGYWKKIEQKDIMRIIRDTKTKSKKAKDTTMTNQQISFDIGPKAGIFSPMTGNISEDFDTNFLWGLNATTWVKQFGFQIEFEKYKDTSKTLFYHYGSWVWDSGQKVSGNSDLRLTSYFSYLYGFRFLWINRCWDRYDKTSNVRNKRFHATNFA